jgi:outer membrane murein-binding lipoprotein Lpp
MTNWAYIQATRQADSRISELEAENARLRSEVARLKKELKAAIDRSRPSPLAVLMDSGT